MELVHQTELTNVADRDEKQQYYRDRRGLCAGALHRSVRDGIALKNDVEMKLISKSVTNDLLEHYRLSIMEDVESIMSYAKELGLVK